MGVKLYNYENKMIVNIIRLNFKQDQYNLSKIILFFLYL